MAAPQSFDDEEPTWEDPPEEAPAEPQAWDEGPWWWSYEQQDWVWGNGEDAEGEGEWPEDDYPDEEVGGIKGCLLYTSPSPRDKRQSRMPSSA